MKKHVAAIAVVIFAACSARTPPVSVVPSFSRPVVTSSSPAPGRRVHVPVAILAAYMVGDALWVYDVKTNNASALAHGGNLQKPQWLSKTEISFVQTSTDGSSATLRIVDLQTRGIRDVFTVPRDIGAYGFSPDRETVAYVTTDEQSYPHVVFRSVSTGDTQSVVTLARALGRGATASDSEHIEFSADGNDVLIVYTPSDGDAGQRIPPEQSQLQVRRLDGTLAVSGSPSREPTMGVWTRDGKTLFFRDDRGVHSWTVAGGTMKLVGRGLQWFDPSVSPNGREIAFDSGLESPRVQVKLFDVRARTVKTISKPGRALPVYAGANTIWVQVVERCKGDCPVPSTLRNIVYALDTRSGRERPLALQTLDQIDVLFE